jgi:hypothetical protein
MPLMLRFHVVLEPTAQQFERFLDPRRRMRRQRLEVLLHLRRHVARFRRAVVADLAVQDRKAFEGRPKKPERKSVPATRTCAVMGLRLSVKVPRRQ